MAINTTNIRIIFIGAIIAVLAGGYKLGQALYTAALWERTEGVVVDFERSVWTCGRWINQCFDLVIGYEVYGKPYRMVSDRRFNEEAPTHLLNSRLPLYYRPGKPDEAVLAGFDGPLRGGVILFLTGTIVLLIFWHHRRNR